MPLPGSKQIATDVPVDIGTSNQIGTSDSLSKADHVHKIPVGSLPAHTHVEADVTDLHTRPGQSTETLLGIAEIATQAETDAGTDDLRVITPAKLKKGTASGVASLDGSGKVPTSQIPSSALPAFKVVADAVARLALTVEEGDEAKQLDDGSHWIYDGTTWVEYPSPPGHQHTVSDLTDTTATAAELTEVTDGSDVSSATHHHDSLYAGGGSSVGIHPAVIATSIAKGSDFVTGTMVGLSPTPAKVYGLSVRESGVTVPSGISYSMRVTKMNADGFDWIIIVDGNEYWPGPSSISLLATYSWSET